MRQPERVSVYDPMFARTDAGEPIKRETTCECGTPFVQRMLSDRFMTAMEKNGAAGEVLRQIPELYVPVFCPPCERRDIGRWARIAESRSLPDIRPSFGERDHAAD